MSPVSAIKYKVSIFSKRYPLLYKVFLFLRGRGKYIDYLPISSSYDFCIEGFQSSANSYMYNITRKLAPDDKIAHHTHTVASIKLAVKNDIPTFFIIRPPDDAIASIVVRKHQEQEIFDHLIDYYIDSYIDLYSSCLKNVRYLSFVDFNDVFHINEWVPIFLEKLSKQSFQGSYLELDKIVKEEMTDWYNEFDPHYDGIPLPGNQRGVDRSHVVQMISNSSKISTARRLYNMLEGNALSIKGLSDDS